MYLSKVRLVNWRSYADATFTFEKPSARRPLVLIGAMNGHGKTSFLVSLYLGLFGRFGLRYCEGFSTFDADDNFWYTKAVSLYRRNTATADEPTSIEMEFTPTLNDNEEEEIRLIRRWYFTSSNKPKPGDSFEQVELFHDGKPYKLSDLDSAMDRLEKCLFPAHVMPAFFFDGEQAQMLINNSGAPGIKKAVEVMFGTKVLEDVHDRIQQYLSSCHSKLGGKKNSTQKEHDLKAKCAERDALNKRIAHLQKQEIENGEEKEKLESERRDAQERLEQLGGKKALDLKQVQMALSAAEQEKTSAERSLTETARLIGLSLAISRLATPIFNRLKAEEVREGWESLRVGTLDRADMVLATAIPEPASADELLGNLSQEVREKVKNRFRKALEQIYNPPPSGCSAEYIFGHAKGEQRQTVYEELARFRKQNATDIRAKSKRLKEAREAYEEAVARNERFTNLPKEVGELAATIAQQNTQISEAIRRLSLIENEIKSLKGDLHALNAEIGRLQEEVAKMEPEQKRIAVAERVHRVMDDLIDNLRPIAVQHLESLVTRHFLSIADNRFKGGRICFPQDSPPVFNWKNGKIQQLDTMSGFERRSFGIAFSLALAEITQKRVPLVIDTPLGNADSEYRPRLLKALTDVDLDQIIILTHDQEVNGDVLNTIERQVSQKFLVVCDQGENVSSVYEGQYFGSRI